MKPQKYPHALIGIPRALLNSDEWRKLTPTAKAIFFQLLTYSDTETFKPVWPASSTLARAIGISRTGISKRISEIERAGLLRSHKPLTKKIDNSLRVSNVYEFTIQRFINEDLRSRGGELTTLYDYSYIESALKGEVKKVLSKIEKQEERIIAIEAVLNSWAKKVSIVGVDSEAIVTVESHSSSVDTKALARALPPYVRLLPSVKKCDAIIDSKASLQLLKSSVERLHDQATRSKRMQPLFDILEKVG